MDIRYLGHSAFEITTNNSKILIDPFLACFPNYKPENITDIFVTHGHGDHLGSSIDISKSTGATITAIFELGNYCSKKGAKVNSMGLGAWKDFSFGRAVLVPAMHSSSTPEGFYAGCPCGIIMEIEGKRIYHAGDTCLNSEIKIIGDIYQPVLSMIPVGGSYTMDKEHAIIASDWLKSEYIIPMHYNTFDGIKVNIEEFRKEIEIKGKTPVILDVNDVFKL